MALKLNSNIIDLEIDQDRPFQFTLVDPLWYMYRPLGVRGTQFRKHCSNVL